ncbi:MAG: DUF1501 domain-containing protein, partial [Bacteroidetes bacterium]
MKRRDFLQTSAWVSAALFTPRFLQSSALGAGTGSRTGKILIVIQLSGGNDGLNTVVPYRNDHYYRLRPSLAIGRDEVLPLTDELGFHPALAPLRELYDEGVLSVLNSVGYPNPDRSHFRSMDIWHSASPSHEYWTNGWLGRYLDSQCQDCAIHHALEVDDGLSLALKGELRKGFAMSNPQRLRQATRNEVLQAIAQQEYDAEHEVAYLYKTLTDTQASADYLWEKSRVHASQMRYPNTEFGRKLKQIAELITADTDTKVYYLSLGGFDTHAQQKGRQERLLKQYAEGVHALVRDLQAHQLFEDTLIMTFSEFGRRVAQNAGGGTDHGTANNLFLLSGGLRQAGFYNAAPDLGQLVEDDLQYEIDFRRVYATIP